MTPQQPIAAEQKVEVAVHVPVVQPVVDHQLLGLQGDIDIYLEPRTRALLQVTGRIDVAGKVRLRLKRAVLK